MIPDLLLEKLTKLTLVIKNKTKNEFPFWSTFSKEIKM